MTVTEAPEVAAGRAAAGVRLEGVGKRFRGGIEALRDVTLDVAPGEFVVLVGPSGCGKSTLLRIIAGLEEVTTGRVHIGTRDVTTQLPQHRDVAMVFQSYALYPRMSVRRNIGFGLRMRRMPRTERDQRVARTARMLGLDEFLDRRPAALSGGQHQRVAMGRAIVREPQLFLMDEPLSNLDAKLRVTMRAQLRELHERLRITTIYVTHDQIEAMTLGDRVAVLRDGDLQQCASPHELFHHPVNLFVAAFIGSPSMNVVQAVAAGGVARFAGTEWPVPTQADGLLIVGIRPTGFAPGERAGWVPMTVVPHFVEEMGDERYVIFDIDAPAVVAEVTRSPSDEALLQHDKATFTVRLPGDVPVTIGEPLRISANPDALYLFDPQTRLAVTGR